MAKPKKRPVLHPKGTATAHAKARLEVRITDSKYEVNLLKEYIQFKRVWFEPPEDKDGWMKLLYSADGPTGDPWPIGKVKIYLAPEQLDVHFGDLADMSIEEAKKE